VDISKAVRSGANALEIDIVNRWPNRLIGDSKLQAGKRFAQTNVKKYDQGNLPLQPSGLMGPVRLMKLMAMKNMPNLQLNKRGKHMSRVGKRGNGSQRINHTINPKVDRLNSVVMHGKVHRQQQLQLRQQVLGSKGRHGIITTALRLPYLDVLWLYCYKVGFAKSAPSMADVRFWFLTMLKECYHGRGQALLMLLPSCSSSRALWV
jgi:hypothetical protein